MARTNDSDDSMRILRVSNWLYPDQVGGGEYHVHAMSRDQAAMGHDVTVLTTATDPEKPREEVRDGYRILRCEPTVRPLGNDISIELGKKLFDSREFDVVHAHSHFYFSTNLAALRRRLGDTPLAITNHSVYSQSAPEWLFRQYLRTIARWTLNQADVVFCYTDDDRRRLRELGVKSSVNVVPNGIDTTRFSPDGPADDRIDGDPAVLFVGRLVEGKRPRDAVEAVDRLLERRPDAQLYVCGDGPLRSELETAAGDHVTFLGQVDHDRMPTVYRSADVLILPSRAEGVPRTVLEAVNSGLPVVCSDLPGVRAVLDGTGETVPVADVEGFSRALARQAETAPAGETDRFSWDRTVADTTAALERIANG